MTVQLSQEIERLVGGVPVDLGLTHPIAYEKYLGAEERAVFHRYREFGYLVLSEWELDHTFGRKCLKQAWCIMCRKNNWPIIILAERAIPERMEGFWQLYTDCRWIIDADLSWQIIQHAFLGHEYMFEAFGSFDVCHLNVKLGSDPSDNYKALPICARLVEAFYWYKKSQPGLHQFETKENDEMVKFFKDGKALALQTDAVGEPDFTRDFGVALQDFLTGAEFEGNHQLETWLRSYAEICCKMRGYKADVKEQRLLTVGEINPSSETLVTSAEHGTQTLKAVA